jgi:hypothetical protein
VSGEAKRADPGRVVAGLTALLTAKKVTPAAFTSFRSTLASFPELLTEEARQIGEAQVLSENNPEAKEAVRRVISELQEF